jgi:hypothetical protein
MPQDVDLEDKLIYGLTPGRFGYLVIAALLAIMLWNLAALPPHVRLPGCLSVCAAGAVLAWASFGGRPADRFLVDALLYCCRAYRLRRWRRRWAELVPVAVPAAMVSERPADLEPRRG